MSRLPLDLDTKLASPATSSPRAGRHAGREQMLADLFRLHLGSATTTTELLSSLSSATARSAFTANHAQREVNSPERSVSPSRETGSANSSSDRDRIAEQRELQRDEARQHAVEDASNHRGDGDDRDGSGSPPRRLDSESSAAAFRDDDRGANGDDSQQQPLSGPELSHVSNDTASEDEATQESETDSAPGSVHSSRRPAKRSRTAANGERAANASARQPASAKTANTAVCDVGQDCCDVAEAESGELDANAGAAEHGDADSAEGTSLGAAANFPVIELGVPLPAESDSDASNRDAAGQAGVPAVEAGAGHGKWPAVPGDGGPIDSVPSSGARSGEASDAAGTRDDAGVLGATSTEDQETARAARRGAASESDDPNPSNRDSDKSNPAILAASVATSVATAAEPNSIAAAVPSETPSSTVAAAPSVSAGRTSRSAIREAGDGQSTAPLNNREQTRLVQRVTRAIQAAQERDGEIRLRLSPPELGSLRLEVRVQAGQLAARLEAESAATRDLLIENLPLLRERLAEQGIQVQRFDVDLMDQRAADGRRSFDGTNANDPRREPRNENVPRQAANTSRSPAAEEPADPAAAATLRRGLSPRINIVV